MKNEYPQDIDVIPHTTVPMPDGTRLAARIWRPVTAVDQPVPVILEYLPYRKNDLTAQRDATMQPHLAAHGYAVVRLDLRGAGDSEGLMVDEYTQRELQDGYDAIAWLAEQPWCDGNVGMIGISWGGFNGLQIAAMQPPALKTIITLCSTDDRYADDIHYMGGCMLTEQLGWASVMFARNTLPPDPENVGEAWREMWRERLRGSGLWLKNWLAHQRRDDFWKHGSICEDYSKVDIPVYAVSGWADGYCRTVFRLVENLPGPVKGLVGPWAHRYPHIGEPGPNMDFLSEELRWWDHWLKGEATGIMEEPQLRLYMQDSVPPAGWYESRPGRWVAEPSWPSPNVTRTPFHLGADGSLSPEKPGAKGEFAHHSPLWVGMGSGKWCAYASPGDAPIDQRREDAGSLCFETAPLTEPLEMAGDANVVLRVSVDRPVAMLAARICDVAPDGASTRASFGVFNLTHRDSHETPEALEPGKVYEITIPMKHVAQNFPVGHRLRLGLSTSYFPMIWTAPEKVTMTLHTEGSYLEMPLRTPSAQDDQLAEFAPAQLPPPLPVEVLEPVEESQRILEDAATGKIEMQIADGSGRLRYLDNDLTLYEQGYERYSVTGDDPDSTTGETEWYFEVSRDGWSVRTETKTKLTVDASDFHISARMRAWEGDQLVEDLTWEETMARDFQ
ncbi:MAG: CocE/NonD family hydrolase [Roseovarius sp.]|uniref:CocE/NonD family hydrolase n=1 Tax=Roseobacteraceae TaxID=2854170 RepID=UPI0032EAF6CE